MSMPLAEHDYIGLSELIPSMEGDSEKPSIFPEANERNKGLNLKATELRLGLPGSQSPERDFGHVVLKGLVSGAKRGFSDTIRRGSGNWVLSGGGGSDPDSAKTESNAQPPPAMASAVGKEAAPLSPKPKPKPEPEKKPQISAPNGQGNAPAAKAQVVGWPPIRSFRKNSLASNNTKNVDHDADAQIPSLGAQVVGWPPVRSFVKNSMASKNPKNVDHDADAKLGPGCLYVKVSMDGAPYLRKIDLKTYNSYAELSSALEKMFSCFTIGQCGSNGAAPGHDGLGDSRLIDHLHGSDYALTFEDKDNDWMLVGDVPWEIFTDSCKRLRIMKRSDAIGLAPRAMEKFKSRN